MALSKEALVDLVLSLQEAVATLTQQTLALAAASAKEVALLRAEVAHLKQQLREKNGPGAPFSKGKRVAKRKPPGRRPGQGPFKHRVAPVALPADQIVEVDAALDIDQRTCPKCDVPLTTQQEEASVIDVPEQPVRKITRIAVEVGVCPICGFKIRATHHALSAHQSGATAHQLGPRVKAQALALHYLHGVPMRRVPGILAQSTGITLTQSAINQLAITLTAPGCVLDSAYQALRTEIAQSAVVHTDDTGWRIDGCTAFLMGFFTRHSAVYQIRWQHRHQEVIEVLGVHFAGSLITDRGSSYEAAALDSWQQQKCLSHLLINCSKVRKEKVGRGREFTATLMALLREGIAHWKEYQLGQMEFSDYREKGRQISQRLGHHLRERQVSDADNQRLLDSIGQQYRAGRVTLFLEHPEIEPTNNRAERGLRPAVIARKVSQCSKTASGARAYATLKSLFCTLALRGSAAVASFIELMQGTPMTAPAQGR